MTKTLCRACPLFDEKQVAGHGPNTAKLIVLGEFPDFHAEKTGIPHSVVASEKRETGSRLLRAVLGHIGLDLTKDIYWQYSLRCNPFKNKQKSIDNRNVLICKHNVESELEPVDAKIILAFGYSPVYQLLGHKNIMTARSEDHEVTIGKKQRSVIFTINPRTVDLLSSFDIKADGSLGSRDTHLGTAAWFFNQDILRLKDKLNL